MKKNDLYITQYDITSISTTTDYLNTKDRQYCNSITCYNVQILSPMILIIFYFAFRKAFIYNNTNLLSSVY